LPPVTIDAPQRQARPKAARPTRRASTTRATQRNRAARAPQAPAAPSPSANAQIVERADGPVNGFVATRSATGTKTDTPIVEVPQSISVVRRTRLSRRAHRA
jgi:iron complex outermembrane receptor protein